MTHIIVYINFAFTAPREETPATKADTTSTQEQTTGKSHILNKLNKSIVYLILFL